ncbi:MAG: efflux RND transporter permease subunit [Myxococcales bacterium]|nr:efflux RND transporter permease subunit [Myxococcales bacterium]
MLSAVVSWSLRNRAVVLLCTLLLIFFGVRAALRLPIDAVPDVTNIQVAIITAAPALSPVEVEQYVSGPVERAMAGLPKVNEIRSISKYGLSVVTIVFDDETNIYFARQMVSERMREAEQAVPARYGKPEIGPITTGLGEVFQFVVRGDGRTLMELEETLDWYIGPQLRMVPGVVEVNSFGGEDKEYQIVFDPQRLQAAGLSVREVIEAVEQSSANAGGGYLEHSREQYVIGTRGQVKSLDDLRTVVVGATPEGVPITVAQIGEVRFGPKLRRGAGVMDGRGEVVLGVALMLMGENSRTVTKAVEAKLKAIEPSLPPGVRIEQYYDRSHLIDRTIATVRDNLLLGAVLVILILLLLLGDLRGGLIVAVTIPLAMLFAIIVMAARGESGNLMSLGAVDFGMIVDGGVIIVENVLRRLHEARVKVGAALSQEERLHVIHDATLEVRGATIFGEAINAIVYLPILALHGTEGKLFQPMSRTVLYALAGAFVLSLTVVPVLVSYFLRDKEKNSETWLLRKASALYRPILGAALAQRGRWLTLSLGVLAMAGGLALVPRLGAEFVPQLDEGDILVEVRRLPGVSLTESVKIETRLQQALLATPEVRSVVSRIGSPELATDPMGIEQSDMYVLLKPRETWGRGLTKEALARQIAERLEKAVPDAALAISQPIQMRTNELVAGVRSDVAAILYGRDLETLRRLGDEVAASLRRVPGVVDVRPEQAAGMNYLRIDPDRHRLARYGLTVGDVNQLTETVAVGYPAGVVFEGERRFDIMVRMATSFDGSVEAIRSLPLKARTGQMVPLGDVAEVGIEKGPALVNREALSRRLLVEFNVRGRDLLSTVRGAQAAMAKDIKLPPGYHVEWGGQFHHYLEARDRLFVAVPLAMGLILFLLWLAFRAWRPALLIFLNIPFAVSGGIVALWLRGIPFSISAGVGFISLFGVAVLNGLVLVSFSREMEAEGTPPGDAMRSAAELRLRAVLMTALVDALGFVPMMISTEPGAEVQRPLATVVIGGLVSATLLTLLVFPAAYAALARRASKPAKIEKNLPGASGASLA